MNRTGLLSELRDYWGANLRTSHLSWIRQLLEMTALFVLRRIGPGYYLQARWGRAEIPFRDKWRHVNRYEYLRIVGSLNPDAYRKASQHKLIEKSVLTMQGFPTPTFIAYVHPTRGRSADAMHVRSERQLGETLARHLNEVVCFKLVEGWGGSGFMSFRIGGEPGSIVLLNADGSPAMSIAQWWAKYATTGDGYLIEAYLRQHAALAALNASSLNTLRLWVHLADEEARILGGYLRVGRAGRMVDNISSGGIVGRLDIERGEVCEAFDPVRPGTALNVHPDSKALLQGFPIPHWEAAKALACEAVRAFPHMRLAGLDVAIGESGPQIIELNVIADYIGCAWMDLPLKDALAQ